MQYDPTEATGHVDLAGRLRITYHCNIVLLLLLISADADYQQVFFSPLL